MDRAPDSPVDRATATAGSAPAVRAVDVAVYEVPLEAAESDGTLTWDSTTLVLVTVTAGDVVGTGYTYAPRAAGAVVEDTLADIVTGRDPLAVGAAWAAMARAVRNQGRRGPVSAAISAVDSALWDLKARLLGCSLVDLIGGYHDAVPVYGSGGFTSLDDDTLTAQVRGWAEQGLPAVKIKVGSDPADDPRRVALVRRTVGDGVDVFVDANGAYTRKQALLLAERFAEESVRWLEEPVTSDDRAGLRLVRDRAPAGMDVTAGEYGWDVTHARDLLDAGAVDCLQADVTRVGGVTGLLRVAALADAAQVDLSGHCAPQLSAHALCGAWHRRHLEYFADHVRLEALAFDGVLEPTDGTLRPDRTRPGHGLDVRWSDLAPYRVRPGGAA